MNPGPAPAPRASRFRVPAATLVVALVSIAVAPPAPLSSAATAKPSLSAIQPGLPVPATRDVNGDGMDDLLGLGGPLATPSIPQPPFPVHVVFGKQDSTFVSVLRPGPWGYTLDGPYGWGAASAGDVNGDGHADLLLSWTASNPTRAVVVLGQADAPTPTPAGRFTLGGDALNVGVDADVFAVGDVNGDGFDDLGAFSFGDAGNAIWLIFGSRHPTDVDLHALGPRGTVIRAPRPSPLLPFHANVLRPIGDLDGDGLDDVAVAADWYPPRTCAVAGSGTERRCDGRVWVIHGRRQLPAQLDVTELGRRAFTVVPGSRTRGRARIRPLEGVAQAGDLDGDGYDDFLVDVNRSERGGSRAVVWGAPRARRRARAVLHARTSRIGGRVEAIGDFDGDGRDDLLSFPDDNRGSRQKRRTFLLRGHRWRGLRSVIPRRDADGYLLFREFSVDEIPEFAAGDVNGDGRADLSTAFTHLGYSDARRTVVVFGSARRTIVRPRAPGSRGFSFGLADLTTPQG